MRRLLLCLAMAAFAAHAAKVSSVKVKLADGGEDTGDVLARCTVKAGDEYDPQQCARDVRTLRDANEFEDISVKAEQSADGVAVTYVVTRKRRFQGPLNVTGNDYWGVGKIKDLSELRDGYPYGEAEIAAAAGRIKTAYQRKFFPDVRVTPRVEPVEGSPNAMKITMEIVEGPRVKIRDLKFKGIEGVEESELREAFQQYPWWNPLGWFVDTPATPQDFAEARDKVADHYRNLGYLDVSVSLPEAVPVEGDSNKVDRVFTVVEGTRYKVGSMSVTGVKQYPADAVLGAVKDLKTGDIAGAKALADAAHAIEVYCGSGEKALADTRVAVRRIPTEEYGDTVDIVFAVEEGVPVVIRRVLVRGNDYTKDKVIRREISLSPGDPMLANLTTSRPSRAARRRTAGRRSATSCSRWRSRRPAASWWASAPARRTPCSARSRSTRTTSTSSTPGASAAAVRRAASSCRPVRACRPTRRPSPSRGCSTTTSSSPSRATAASAGSTTTT